MLITRGMQMRGLITFLILVITVTASCSSDAGDIVSQSAKLPEAKLTVLSGSDQTVLRGDSLGEPIRVRLDTAGVPAQSNELEIIVQAHASPGPNHTWYAVTDVAGVASVNGVINNATGPASITVKYVVCVVPGFKSCSKLETRATVVVPVQIKP